MFVKALGKYFQILRSAEILSRQGYFPGDRFFNLQTLQAEWHNTKLQRNTTVSQPRLEDNGAYYKINTIIFAIYLVV